MSLIDRDKGGEGGSGIPRSEIPESTGLKVGGFISQGVGDTIDYTAYSGVIVDATTYPNIDTTVFGDTGVYSVNTSVDGTYLLAVDSTNTFNQIDINAFSSDERRDNVNFGAFTVAGGSLVSVTPARQDSNEVYQQLLDLMACFGTIRCDGLGVAPSGLLQFDMSSGVVMSIGAGATNAERPQNTLSVNASANASFRALLGKTNTINPVSQTSIDPENYDDGSGSAVAIGGSGSRSTIQYIYLIPTGPNASIYVMYGQTIYSTLQDALDAGIEDRIELPLLYAKSALLLGRVALRNDATDLEDPLQARFLAGARFGSGLFVGSAAGGGGGGDVIGAADSNTNELPTFSDGTGKVIKSESDISALAGVLSRISIGNLILRASTSRPIELDNSTGDTDVLVSAPAGGKAGFSFRIDDVGVGGVGASDAGYLKFGIGSYNNALNGLIINENGWASIGNRLTTSNELNSIAFGVFATDRGFKPPVLTNAQRNAIAGSVDGLTIYNSDAKELQSYNEGLSAWGKAKAILYGENNTTPSATSGTSYVPMQIGSSSLIGAIGFTGLDSRTIRYNGSGSTFSIRLTTNLRSADGQATNPYRWEVTVSVNGSAVLPTATTQVMDGNDGANVVLDLQNITLNTNDTLSLRIRQTSGAIETQPIAKNTTLEVKEY